MEKKNISYVKKKRFQESKRIVFEIFKEFIGYGDGDKRKVWKQFVF